MSDTIDTELAGTPAISDAQTEPQIESTEPSEVENKEDASEVEKTDDKKGQEAKPELTEAQKIEYAMKKRIDRMTWALNEEKRKRQDAEEKVKLVQAMPQPQNQSNAEPKESDFDTIEAYLEAKGEWKATQKFLAGQKAKEQEEKQKQHLEMMSKRSEEFSKKEAEFKKDVPDYDEAAEVVNEALRYADKSSEGVRVFSDIMISSDVLPQLTYAIGKDPDFIDQLTKATPLEIARSLFYKEYEIKNGKNVTQPTKPTAAPPNPIKGQSNAKPEDSLSGKDLLKRYKLR